VGLSAFLLLSLAFSNVLLDCRDDHTLLMKGKCLAINGYWGNSYRERFGDLGGYCQKQISIRYMVSPIKLEQVVKMLMPTGADPEGGVGGGGDCHKSMCCKATSL
jgi:hypothetical protein